MRPGSILDESAPGTSLVAEIAERRIRRGQRLAVAFWRIPRARRPSIVTNPSSAQELRRRPEDPCPRPWSRRGDLTAELSPPSRTLRETARSRSRGTRSSRDGPRSRGRDPVSVAPSGGARDRGGGPIDAFVSLVGGAREREDLRRARKSRAEKELSRARARSREGSRLREGAPGAVARASPSISRRSERTSPPSRRRPRSRRRAEGLCG